MRKGLRWEKGRDVHPCYNGAPWSRRGETLWTPTRIALTALLFAIIVIAVIAIIFVIIGEFGTVQQRILATVGTIAGMVFLAVPSTNAIERGLRALGWAGIASTAVIAVLVIILLWRGEAVLSEGYGRASGIIATLAVATNLAALMSRLAATPGLSRRLQVGSYGLTALTALLIIVGILAQLDMGRYWIAVFVCAILLAAVTLAAPIADRLARGAAGRVDTPQGQA